MDSIEDRVRCLGDPNGNPRHRSLKRHEVGQSQRGREGGRRKEGRSLALPRARQVERRKQQGEAARVADEKPDWSLGQQRLGILGEERAHGGR